MTWNCVIFYLFLAFFHSTQSVERDITFPISAQGEECFYETALIGQILEIDYQVVDGGSDGHYAIDFSITRPDGRPIVMEIEKIENTHQIAIEQDGDYKICFDNTKSRSSSKLIFFELLLDNDGSDDLPFDQFPDEEDYASNEVDVMSSSLKFIKEKVTKSRHLQEQIRAHEFRDRSIAEHNFERVNFWSIVQVFIMVGAGLTQVVMIRSIFDEKSPIRKLFK